MSSRPKGMAEETFATKIFFSTFDYSVRASNMCGKKERLCDDIEAGLTPPPQGDIGEHVEPVVT